MFKIAVSPDALKELSKLDAPVSRRLSDSIEWLAANADKIIHHRLSNLPEHLRGLCKRREGDYRIIYWVFPREQVIKVYGIFHRSTEYDMLK
ncbi:MAG: type II toxin-antitoxin system RelE/ParE family toxin [Planctomycetota bacterium]|nr:type II toxin-antitoxin system RelE/ParE family toxin [Planctomycetota bacterium]